jgi:hypothetical protein
MATRTWERRELPLLEVIAEADAAGRSRLASDEVARASGLPSSAAEAGLRALLGAEMISGIVAASHDGWALLNIRLEEAGRRAVGQWPSANVYEELLRVIDARIAYARDEDERSRLERLRDAVRDVGTGVISAALYDLLRRLAAGMP